jgi:zinc transporter ZupT
VTQVDSDFSLTPMNSEESKRVVEVVESPSKDTEWVEKTIAPVAWIIIAGESLHNLVDGMSIGAAFSDNVVQGVSLSIAIICEEFPHKLGIVLFFI